jgi:hypothetical protein
MQAKVGEPRAGEQVLSLHHGEVLTLRRINKDKRQPFTLKESQGFLSMRLRKPIPITQLNCKPLITKKRGELLEFVELVFVG